MKNFVIVLAGGNGSRMKSSVPKQFLLLKGLPVLMHTLQAFFISDIKPEIILVIAASEQQAWRNLCFRYNFTVPHILVAGGKDRFDSVFNGLKYIKGLDFASGSIINKGLGLIDTGINAGSDAATGAGAGAGAGAAAGADTYFETTIVGVHDGVRPLLSNNLISLIYKHAFQYSNAVPCLECRESLRLIEKNDSVAVNRASYRAIQTPQGFRFSELLSAYESAGQSEYTDDASVAQRAGIKINLVDGEYSNIKITVPVDLLIAEALLKVENQ